MGEPEFISLADLLRVRTEPPRAVNPTIERAPEATPQAGQPVPVEPEPRGERCAVVGDSAEALRAARRFRAALADTFDALVATLMDEFSAEVLGRELQLAPADLTTIARRLVAQRLADEPLRLRVAPADALLVCDIPVVVDPALARGDAILECRSGDIDARLCTRLAALAGAGRTE